MQVDEGSRLRTHILVNTQLFEDVSEEEDNYWPPRPRGQGELEQMKQADIFAHESSRHFLSSLKLEDDSNKGRAQGDLEDRMRRMRLMRTRRTTFSANKMTAGLDENLNLKL